jgi:hypothetical protein
VQNGPFWAESAEQRNYAVGRPAAGVINESTQRDAMESYRSEPLNRLCGWRKSLMMSPACHDHPGLQ